jgi:putative two-component system response regulator
LHRFDLVLLDLDMPHLTGFEVMAKLKKIELENYLPILVLTAMTDSQTRLRALESGAKDFIVKHPFDRLETMTRIRNMLEVRLAHNMVRDQNRVLEERVLERTRELQETRLEIIQRLGRAIEYHDNETGLHVVRMSRYCECLARVLGLPDEQCEMLLHTSPMHDIGKVAISDTILLKPGPLDPEEFEIIKTHTTIGAAILAGHPSKLMEMAHNIALTHHEKWDGTGYPNALKGENIPIEGRISAICDVFDALTNDRPYKRRWTNEAAVGYLQDNRGIHFDPVMVDAFCSTLHGILEIQKRFSEPVCGEKCLASSLPYSSVNIQTRPTVQLSL